jgi:hypothetical protein
MLQHHVKGEAEEPLEDVRLFVRSVFTLTYLQSYRDQQPAEVSNHEHNDIADQAYQKRHPAKRIIVSDSAKQNRHEKVLLTSHTE